MRRTVAAARLGFTNDTDREVIVWTEPGEQKNRSTRYTYQLNVYHRRRLTPARPVRERTVLGKTLVAARTLTLRPSRPAGMALSRWSEWS